MIRTSSLSKSEKVMWRTWSYMLEEYSWSLKNQTWLSCLQISKKCGYVAILPLAQTEICFSVPNWSAPIFNLKYFINQLQCFFSAVQRRRRD